MTVFYHTPELAWRDTLPMAEMAAKAVIFGQWQRAAE
jgi:hypothetical protein